MILLVGWRGEGSSARLPLIFLHILCLIQSLFALVPPPLRCERGSPEGVQGQRSRPEGRFALHISANPLYYVPGDMYTVTLNGIRGAKFIGFTVYVEGGGNLYLYGDALTKFSESCPGAVTHATQVPKPEVQVLWTAPPPGTGCVTFRATIIEHRDLWYQDDGPLSKTLCEDAQTRDEDQLPVNQHCCACDEAKYEVTFEGLWSRHTHPKDFPSNTSWIPRFSDVIGASHTTEYRFWDYGGIASEGLKQVAEKGSTRMLESELKSQSQHIRTIIKARGISYPNVTGKTFAVFRVDNVHHLISLVSMIDPSPDWIVGVSGLELCLSNCSWLETKVINLFPWDAGTDSGITYTSPDFPTEPRDHIRRITSSFPSDQRSPFFDPSGEEMKPLARLYLTRQRLYEKSCSVANMEYNNNEACEVGEWSDYSPCSATCGTGTRTRQRFYKNEQRADLNHCNRQLTSREICSAPFPCRGVSMHPASPNEPEEEDRDTLCAMSNWSPWSGCSVSCGQGERHRFRNLKIRRNWKKCMAMKNPPATKQDDICIGEEGPVCPEVGALESRACEVGAWSEWSACSVSCGEGKRTRVRELTEGPCPGVKTHEEIPCIGELPTCRLTPQQAKDACQMPKVVGPCRGHFEKWFFDALTQTCHKFGYSGCGGNRNQFETKEECEEVCRELKEELIANRTARLQQLGVSLTGSIISNGDFNQPISNDELTTPKLFNDIKPESFLRNLNGDDYYTVTGTDGPVVDCRVTHWSAWSECSVTCGRGLKLRTRHIVAHSKNGGKVCPKKLLKRRKCNAGPCERDGFDRENNYSAMDDYDDSSYRDDCIYSEWTRWSLCSLTCGSHSVQQRTRAIDLLRTPPSALCSERVETRVCNVPPCPIYPQ